MMGLGGGQFLYFCEESGEVGEVLGILEDGIFFSAFIFADLEVSFSGYFEYFSYFFFGFG